MQPFFAELIAVAAAAASLYAAYAKTMIPLRAGAIVASFLVIIYSFVYGAYAMLLLNAVLLLVNAWRLRAMLILIRDINAATRSDVNVDWLLPFTRPKRFKAGDIVMERGEYATAAFYIVSGEVEIVDTNERLGIGSLLGEIGLFTPDGRRTMTVRCKTDVQTAQIDYDQFKELYFQNPQFGFHLLHLIVARLRESGRPHPASPS
jgi:CRP/FNR family transcriptional regulator, cyclic AMP receptor protein